jgi:hypothetical protein
MIHEAVISVFKLNWKKMIKPMHHQKKFHKSKHAMNKTECHLYNCWKDEP